MSNVHYTPELAIKVTVVRGPGPEVIWYCSSVLAGHVLKEPELVDGR